MNSFLWPRFLSLSNPFQLLFIVAFPESECKDKTIFYSRKGFFTLNLFIYTFYQKLNPQ